MRFSFSPKRPAAEPPQHAPDMDPAAPPHPIGMEAQIEREPSRFRRCMRILGPGITAGASNNDPSAIATYAQAGAAFGFATLWAVPLLLPMMAGTVYLCAKLAMVSGKGLAGVLVKRHSRGLVYPLVGALAIANTFNAGVDIGAVASGIGLLFPLPRTIVIIGVGVLVAILQIWASYRTITSVFRWLTLALFAFIAAGLLAKPHAADVIRNTLIPSPHFTLVYLSTIVAMIGTGLSPYLFFWQTGQRVEEEVCYGRRRLWQRRGATEGELKYASLDVNTGMFFGALIIYFIILSAGATLYLSGQHQVTSAADVAGALRPLAGRFASILFSLGFIGSGLLAIPVLTTGVAYAVSDLFNWEAGLNRKPRRAPRFYAVIAASTLIGVLVNFTPLNPMRALFLAAVVNGLLTPVVLVLVMLASSNPQVMGAQRNGLGMKILGWATTAATIAAATALLASLLR